MKMSENVKNDLLQKLQKQYMNRGRRGKSHLINMMVDVYGYNRKYAIKLLCGKTNRVGNPILPKGHPIRYGAQVVDVLGSCLVMIDWKIRLLLKKLIIFM